MANRAALAKDLTSHPVTSYINSLTSRNSKRAMLSALKTILGVALEMDPQDIDPLQVYEFSWPTITPDKMNALKAALLARYSRAHSAKCVAAVRGVIGASFDMELINADQFMRLRRVKGVSVRRNSKAGRKLAEGEIRALAQACADDTTPAGARDDSIIGLGYTQGPRISEIAKLELSDYDPAVGDLVIRGAKGGKTRTVRVSNSTKDSLDEWISLRGDVPGPLFCPVDKAGHTHVTRLSTTAIGKMLRKRASQAGVKPFTMHDLRRTFLTNGWAIGIPGTQLKMIAGHSSIETTAAYDRGDLEEALKASARLHYPSLRHARV